jgi:tetratricopeptide (TPR) repeat protein
MKEIMSEESESIQSNDDNAEEAENKTVYQQRLDRRQKQTVRPIIAYALLGSMALILILVVFLLPRMVNEDEASTTNQNLDETRVEQMQLDEAVLAQKPIAQALLSELLAKIDELELSGVQIWAQPEWKKINTIQDEGDTAYLNRSYDMAAASYRTAMQLLIDLEVAVPSILQQSLSQGQAAILQENKPLAISNFETALAIDGSNQLAKAGLDRALKLDKVIALSNQGKRLAEEREWIESIEAFQAALAIDSNWKPALEGLTASILSNDEEQFQLSLSEGFALMKEQKFEEAEVSFRKSLSIVPDSKEGQQAIEELEIQRRIVLTKSLKYKALIAEVNEEWDNAESYYETILSLDPNIQEVKDSLLRVRQRIKLINQMISFIAKAEQLNDDKLFSQAQETLKQAEAILNKGPELIEQVSKMQQVLKVASIPLQVTLISDQKTNVVIYKKGDFGLFERQPVLLKPGIYTAKGMRIGYRDTTLRFKVDPNQSEQSFTVICREKI